MYTQVCVHISVLTLFFYRVQKLSAHITMSLKNNIFPCIWVVSLSPP